MTKAESIDSRNLGNYKECTGKKRDFCKYSFSWAQMLREATGALKQGLAALFMSIVEVVNLFQLFHLFYLFHLFHR